MSHQLKFRLVMAFFMSLFMALIMSGVIMAARIGFAHPEYFSIWLDAFLLAWPVAFPTAMIVSPIAQKLALMILPPLKT